MSLNRLLIILVAFVNAPERTGRSKSVWSLQDNYSGELAQGSNLKCPPELGDVHEPPTSINISRQNAEAAVK